MSAERYERRRHRALEMAEEAGLEGLLVSPGPDLVYLTGHDPPPLERLTLLLLMRNRDPVLVVPELERLLASSAPGAAGVQLASWTDARDDPYETVARVLRAGRYAVSDQTWAAHLLALEHATADCLFTAAGRTIPMLRAVKDDAEIESLGGAAAAADTVFGEIASQAFAGRTERAIAADLSDLLRQHGHERVEFTIVASGPNAASSHHDSGDRTVGPGDAVVMDFGGVRERYCSDITRTVFVGEPDQQQREVYEVVRTAQQAAFEAVRPGVPAQEVDRAARAVIAASGYGERFVHRTGHGIGLEVHEHPYIVEGNETPLAPGMTFSDEPGIYLEGRFGVRIEDQVVVTATGAERLNHASRDLAVVG